MISAFLRTHWIISNDKGELVVEVAPKGYSVTSYSSFRSYTLTSWKVSQKPEPLYGESLWYNQQALASSGGALDLYDDTYDANIREIPVIQQDRMSAFKLIKPTLGLYQLPKSAALYLRNAANQVHLVLE